MKRTVINGFGLMRRHLSPTIGFAALLVSACIGLGCCVRAMAESASSGPEPSPFEVVTLKKVSESDPSWGGMRRSPGLVQFPRDTLAELIGIAYEIAPEQVSAIPEWAKTARYEIVLKAPESAFVGPFHGEAQAQTMLRVFLADRFKLKVHQETRTLYSAALVVGPDGLKMAQAQTVSGDWQGIELDSGQLRGQGAPMMRLARIVSLSMDLPVLDRTRLEGTYDFSAQWTPADNKLSRHQWYYSGVQPPASVPISLNVSPSFKDALQQQLGLILEPAKDRSVQFVVIDSVGQPSDAQISLISVEPEIPM